MSETYLVIRPRFSDHYYESHAVSQLFVVAIAEFQPHGYFLVVILVTYNLPMLMYICSILLSLLFNLLLTYLLTTSLIVRIFVLALLVWPVIEGVQSNISRFIQRLVQPID